MTFSQLISRAHAFLHRAQIVKLHLLRMRPVEAEPAIPFQIFDIGEHPLGMPPHGVRIRPLLHIVGNDHGGTTGKGVVGR
jgi:hypothetical protein